jgi:hypothetical protein
MEWKPIPNYEECGFISSTGLVKNLKGIIRKLTISKYGYLRVGFKGGSITIPVHRLVANAFVSGKQEGLIINHIDGNKLNNDASNLEWVTPSYNVKHGFMLGRIHPRGRMLISDDDFKVILKRIENGEQQKKLAAEYGVSPAAICKRKKEYYLVCP